MRQVFLVFIFCFSVMLSHAFAADEVAPEITAAFEEGKAAYDAGDYEKAYEIWLPLAKGGHPKSQNALGILYGTIDFSSYNLNTELSWHLKAAENNYAPAQFNLFLINSGEKALFWLLVAAMNNHPKSLELFDDLKADANLLDATKPLINKAKEWHKSRGHPFAILDY